MVSQLHQPLLKLIPGGAKKYLSAAQAKVLLAKVCPRDVAGKARRRVAAELIANLERTYGPVCRAVGDRVDLPRAQDPPTRTSGSAALPHPRRVYQEA